MQALPYLMLAVSAAQAVQQKRAANFANAQQKLAAKNEEVDANRQAIERRKTLIRVLSARNAQAGAAGIETSGSQGAQIRADINDAQNDLLYLTVNADAKQKARRLAMRSNSTQANAAAATSLLDGVAGASSLGGKTK